MKENKFFGLEWAELLILLAVYLFVFLFSNQLILNFLLIASFYFSLRLYKKNKPPRYTENLIRRLILPCRYTQDLEGCLK